MDELKLLIEMVANLPGLALWVLVIFFAYKVIVVGSIYGVIRFGIEKLHSWLTTPRSKIVTVDIQGEIERVCITKQGAHTGLLTQLDRIRGVSTGSAYIHESDVRWLRDAIDAKLHADSLAKQK